MGSANFKCLSRRIIKYYMIMDLILLRIQNMMDIK